LKLSTIANFPVTTFDELFDQIPAKINIALELEPVGLLSNFADF